MQDLCNSVNLEYEPNFFLVISVLWFLQPNRNRFFFPISVLVRLFLGCIIGDCNAKTDGDAQCPERARSGTCLLPGFDLIRSGRLRGREPMHATPREELPLLEAAT